MMQPRSINAALLAFVVATMLVLAGCSDDNCTCVNCNGPDPTLASIWPNEDGTWWTYDYESRVADAIGLSVYENEEDVPPAPSMDHLELLLRLVAPGNSGEALAGTYALIFDGMTTTGSGVTAQNLIETLGQEGGSILGSGKGSAVHPLMSRLALARPDLVNLHSYADAFGRVSGMSRDQALAEPLLIHGGAWEKTDEWIGTYGDLDTLLAWKFLDSDLSPGHEFTHQLVPSVAHDVSLRLRILRHRMFRLSSGMIVTAVQCLYRIDYGIYSFYDLDLEHLVYARSFGYGIVVYAPTVGPVYCHERPIIDAGNPTSLGIGYITVELDESNLLPD